jgi:hypothetical protein
LIFDMVFLASFPWDPLAGLRPIRAYHIQ